MKKRSFSSPQLHSSSSSSSSSSVVDPKLFHLVRKFVAGAEIDSFPSVHYVANCLRTQHREYQRKDITWLKRNIAIALEEETLLRQASTNTKTNNTTNNNTTSGTVGGSRGSKKRPLEPNHPSATAATEQPPPQLETKEERQHETFAQEHDRIRQELSEKKGSGSMLNASLRNRYKEVQQERDTVTRTTTAAVVTVLEEDDEDDENEEDQALHQAEHNIRAGDDMQDVVAGGGTKQTTTTRTTPPTSSVPAKSPKKPKRKKRSSTTSSSQDNNKNGGGAPPRTMMPGGGGGEAADFATPVVRPRERYVDLGGMTEVLQQIKQLIEYPLVRPELYRHLGVDPPRGVLLRGPPGCGKTHLANAIAGQLGIPYFRVSAPELVSGMSGESEGRIRDLFKAASDAAPSLVFMDELDAIAPKRGDSSGSGSGMQKRMVAQLLTSLDSIDPQYNRMNASVLVLGATNRPDAMDPALRRAGRFDKEIVLGVPDEEAREGIIRAMTKNMRLSGDFDLKSLARKTPGYVGADVRSLTKEAAVIAINRIFKDVLTDQDLPSTSLPTIIPVVQPIEPMALVTTEPMALDATKPMALVTTEPMALDATKPMALVTSEPMAVVTNGNEPTETKNSILKEEPSKEGSSTDGPSEDKPSKDALSVVPLTSEQMEPLYVTMGDFLAAVPLVQPSSKREGFATVPDVSWDDIGALSSVREELSLSVLEPIRHPEKFKALGLTLPTGVMLYGPPGCGKTLLAKAIANESGANFISVKGPELLDKYVGESERAVRTVFERARSSSPCVVFFDELDSLCPKRGSDGGGGGGVSERVVNQLLTEMDGLDSRRTVFVIAATNRPELIDPAMMRPGRLDKLLYVPLPTPDDRVSILKAVSGGIKLGPDVCLEELGRSPRAEGYSGADCSALLREAGLAVLKESQHIILQADMPMHITARHFHYAFDHVMPSVSRKDQARYDRMRQRMARARSRGGVEDDEKTEQRSDKTTGTAPDATPVEVPSTGPAR